MHRLSIAVMWKHLGKILLLGAVLLTCAGLAIRKIDADDPSLKLVGYDLEYRNEPATGIVYSLFLNWHPKQLYFLWQGKRVGKEFIWYDNGNLMAVYSYGDGLPDGDWKMWHEDGSVKSLKRYDKGVIDGESWGWHANGQISDYNLYSKGEEITHKSWVFDGKPYYNYVYQNGKKIGLIGGEFCKRLEILKK